MKRLDLAQNTPEWHAWRRDRLGGSDVPAVLGISPFEDHTRASVLAAKVHGRERPQNGAMYRGTVLEPHARDLYQRRFRTVARPACVEMDGCPWAAASLDGLCTNGAEVPGERLDWLVEIKCGSWELHGRTLAGEPPPDYYAAQVQWQLLVSGLGLCDFASFNPGERFTPSAALPWDEWRMLPVAERPEPPADWLAVVRVAADEKYQAHLLAEAGRFWFEVEEARAALGRQALTA